MRFVPGDSKLVIPFSFGLNFQLSARDLRGLQARVLDERINIDQKLNEGLTNRDLSILDALISEVIREFPKVENNERN